MPSTDRERDHGLSRVTSRQRERERNRSRSRSPRTDRRSRDLNEVYTVFIKHLPEDVKADDIRRVFSEYGQITDIGMPRDYFTGRLKGYAFVDFETDAQADKAMHALDKSRPFGGSMAVECERARGNKRTPSEMIARNRTRDDTRRPAEPALSLPGRPLSYEYEEDRRYGRGGPPSASYGRGYGYESALSASAHSAHPSNYGGYTAPSRSGLPPGPTPLLSLSTGPYPPAASYSSLPGGRSPLAPYAPAPYPSSDPYAAARSALYPRDRYSIERERERERERDRERELWERRLMRFSPDRLREREREREREFRPSSREQFRDVLPIAGSRRSPSPYSNKHRRDRSPMPYLRPPPPPLMDLAPIHASAFDSHKLGRHRSRTRSRSRSPAGDRRDAKYMRYK